jgi:hypothetical protein
MPWSWARAQPGPKQVAMARLLLQHTGTLQLRG